MENRNQTWSYNGIIMRNKCQVYGKNCFIKLTQGKMAIIDVGDMEFISQYRWFALKGGNTFYAVSKEKCTNKTIYMHRLIMNTPYRMHTDHISRQGTDNRRVNLRVVTCSENILNVRSLRDSPSGFLGVTLNKRGKKWRARISVNGKGKYIGSYDTPEEARDARAVYFVGICGTEANPEQTLIAQNA